MIRVKDLPDKPKCPRCSSYTIGLLKVEEEKAARLLEKKGEHLSKDEEKMYSQAKKTAELIEKYGNVAAVGLSARHISVAALSEVLSKEPKLSDKFYELVLEAERKVLSRRFNGPK